MAIDLKNNKQVIALKKGFEDIKTVGQEGNLKLFVKQFVAVLLVFLAFRYFSGKFADEQRGYDSQMESLKVQQASEQEYMQNKKLLLSLEPRFPDISNKNDWLLGHVLGIFKDGKLKPQVSGTQTEDASNPTYIAVALDVNTDADFTKFANFLADIENHADYIKVSSFSLKKDISPAALGNNQISMRFNTIFPKEKIAEKLFKDYKQLMAQKNAKQQTEEAK